MRQSEKDPKILILQQQPLNAAPQLERLSRAFITPRERFFVRNHSEIPQVTVETFALTVTGLVSTPLRLTLDELARFPRRTVTATLMCAGNRRNELVAVAPILDELLWNAGAISNATWEGVALADVLAAAHVEPEAAHIAFQGLDEIEKLGQRNGFGGSIPLEKALSNEVLLADTMNGKPLAPAHGFPLRVVVPGYIGARSVKWLTGIHVQRSPSENYYQAHAYKLFAPDITAATVDWSKGTMIGEAPLTSAICVPETGAIVGGGEVALSGYAFAGGRIISRVEVSWDGQPPWVVADLAPDGDVWTWRLWRAVLPAHGESRRIVVRAWDSEGSCQPEQLAEVWNFKGYLNTAWHSVTIRAGTRN